MADDTLMDLIDAYAEARHVGGCHTYNAKTAEARAKVVASLAASAESEPVAWPKDAAEVREFFNSDFISAKFAAPDGSPCDEDRYYISAHDFLSAINWWADFPHHPSPPEGMAGWKPTFDMRAVVAVAVTMLYETHPKDVCRVFDLRELEKIVNITELLGSQQVEDIYRSAWDHLAAPPLPASEAKEL